MRHNFAILFSLSLLILVSCDNDSSNNFPSNKHLMEQDPILFAKAFIEDAKNQASKEVYSKYLHTKARNELEKGSSIAILMYKNALSENTLLSEIKSLEMKVTPKNEGKTIFIRYKLPNAIDLKTVYPNSPTIDQGWIIKEGQITLDRDNDRWGVTGHTMVGEKKSS